MDNQIAEMERALHEEDRTRFLDHDQAFRTILFGPRVSISCAN